MKTQLLLTRAHTHADRKRQPGDRIEADSDLALAGVQRQRPRAASRPNRKPAASRGVIRPT